MSDEEYNTRCKEIFDTADVKKLGFLTLDQFRKFVISFMEEYGKPEGEIEKMIDRSTAMWATIFKHYGSFDGKLTWACTQGFFKENKPKPQN